MYPDTLFLFSLAFFSRCFLKSSSASKVNITRFMITKVIHSIVLQNYYKYFLKDLVLLLQ